MVLERAFANSHDVERSRLLSGGNGTGTGKERKDGESGRELHSGGLDRVL